MAERPLRGATGRVSTTGPNRTPIRTTMEFSRTLDDAAIPAPVMGIVWPTHMSELPSRYTIRDRQDGDIPWIRALLYLHWGDTLVVAHGEVIDVLALPGLVAGDRAGLAAYRVSGTEAELVTLDAVEAGRGVGTQLVIALVERLRPYGVKRLRVTTTNDNTSALAFYQKRGFRLERVRVDAIDETRRLKPGIPLLGQNGIPIRDEIDLYRDLCG